MLQEPQFNKDHVQWDPCEPCLKVIQDTVAAWTDRPSAAEDELGDDDALLREYYGPLGEL